MATLINVWPRSLFAETTVHHGLEVSENKTSVQANETSVHAYETSVQANETSGR